MEARPASPAGSLVIATFPRTGDSGAWLVLYADQIQSLRNAASPVTNTFRLSSSLNSVTLGGEIVPTQRLALLSASIVLELFTEMVPSFSIRCPPPCDTCHSRASQVSPSLAAPCHTKPQKWVLPADRSAALIR